MGPESEALAAAMRGYGVAAEMLPRATVETIRLGRRHTSGKECLPMTVTAGALLERLERGGDEPLVFFMPGSNGPCRFGMYRQLHQMIVDRLGHGARVGIWSPPDSDYFEGVPPGLGAIVLAGCAAFGMLEDALRDVRPVESRAGAAAEIHARHAAELSRVVEAAARGDLSGKRVLLEVFSGRLYGIRDVVARAARELRAVKLDRAWPTVLLVGEIYVRSDPASNGYVADELERRGLRVRLEPVVEYLQYSEYNQFRRGLKRGVKDALQAGLRSRIVHGIQHAVAHELGWPSHPRVEDLVETARPYLGPDLEHEAVMAIGLPLWAHRSGLIDGVVNAGPLECMPSKLAEAQLVHVGTEEGLHSMTLALNGDPLDPETLDDFAYEVRERFRARALRRGLQPAERSI
jgi:predicted nucleotide-binding protein (sugar kinase/HSP70/actin superfamily)